MSSRPRPRLVIAGAAILVLVLPVAARAQTSTPPIRTQPSEKVLERAAGEAAAPEPPPTSVEIEPGPPRAPDFTVPTPPSPVPSGKARLGPVLVDPYPDNPRCWVAGRYVPSPPLCPN